MATQKHGDQTPSLRLFVRIQGEARTLGVSQPKWSSQITSVPKLRPWGRTVIVVTCERVYRGRIVLVKLINVGRPMVSQFLGPGGPEETGAGFRSRKDKGRGARGSGTGIFPVRQTISQAV